MLLDSSDILTLSLFSKTSPSVISPLCMHYLIRGLQLESSSCSVGKDCSHLLNDGLLVSENGQTFLAKPLEPLLALLNEPETVITFARKALADAEDFSFCFNAAGGCLLSVNSAGTLNTLVSPVLQASLPEWFSEELLSGVGGQSTNEPTELYLTASELLILSAMQRIYKKRIAHFGAPLDVKFRNICAKEIMQDLSSLKTLPSVFGALYSQQELKRLTATDAFYEKTFVQLVTKGYLELNKIGYGYSRYMELVFDLGSLRDVVTYTRQDAGSAILKKLFIYDRIFALFEPSEDKKAFKIIVLPISYDKQALFNLL